MNYYKTIYKNTLLYKEDEQVSLSQNAILKGDFKNGFEIIHSPSFEHFNGIYHLATLYSNSEDLDTTCYLEKVKFEDLGEIIQQNKHDYFNKIHSMAIDWAINAKVDKEYIFDVLYKSIEKHT